jgi:hypothetical protein
MTQPDRKMSEPAKTLKLQNRGWENVMPPSVPNFIIRASDKFPIPIQELSDAQLKRIGKAYTDALLFKAQMKRKYL